MFGDKKQRNVLKMRTLFLTDLDGTFLGPDAKVSAESAAIINSLTSKGLLFSIATARTFATVVPLFKQVDLRIPLVLMNGVCIYDPLEKKTLSVHSIPPEAGMQIDSLFERFGKNPLLYFEHDSKLTVKYKALDNDNVRSYVNEREAFFNKTFEQASSFDFSGSGNFVYVVTLDKKDALEGLYGEMKKIKALDCNFYSDNYTDCYFLEAMRSGINKGTGAAELKKTLGADRLIAFGDNINDIPLFKAADECYAVENACDELKSIATGVIGSNSENAVAKFIEKKFYEDRQVR